MSTKQQSLPPAHLRVLVSLLLPLVLAIIFSTLVGNRLEFTADGLIGPSIFLGTIGLSSWFIGQGWYGIKGMGIRGGRPMFAGAGFAFLGWVALLIFRFYFIESEPEINSGISAEFIYKISRVNDVAERFTHLSSVLISNQSMEIYCSKWYLTKEEARHQYHACHPEKDNVIAGLEYACGVIDSQIFGFFRPAEG